MSRMLKAKAPRLLRKHMAELESMLSTAKAPVKEVAAAGLIPLVAKHLLSSDKKLAASAVHSIASITYKCSTSVMKAGCVSKLVELVCEEDGDIARNAIFALSNLAVDFQDQLLSNNALKQILGRLRQLGEPSGKKDWMLWADAMRLITNLINITDKDDSSTKDMVKKTLKIKGDRVELIRILKVSLKCRDQPEIIEDALRGILSLAKLHVCKHCGIPKLLDMEVIPLLTSQFSHSCAKIKKLAVDCIQDVVYNSVLDVSKCRPSPIPPLKQLMQSTNPDLSTCAALVLSNIACEGEEAIEALKSVGLFESMVSLLLNPNTTTELKTEAAWFVINVCGSGARRHLEEIVELGAVHGLSRWVLKTQKDTKMVEETVAALRSVCDILLPKSDELSRLSKRPVPSKVASTDANARAALLPAKDAKAPADKAIKSENKTQAPCKISAETTATAKSAASGSPPLDKTTNDSKLDSGLQNPGKDAGVKAPIAPLSGADAKLHNMLRDEETLDLVSSYVDAAKTLAHFEVSDGLYPSAISTLERIKNENAQAKELLAGPLAGGSRAWLERLSESQLAGILEHLSGRRQLKAKPEDATQKTAEGGGKDASKQPNEASTEASTEAKTKAKTEAKTEAKAAPSADATKGQQDEAPATTPAGQTPASNDSKAQDKAQDKAGNQNPLSDEVNEALANKDRSKMVRVMSRAINMQLQKKLLAHYNRVRVSEQEKRLQQQHGFIDWTIDVMHPQNIKKVKLVSKPFSCGEFKCHVLLYPWGNPNRPEAHKTHLSVYVAVLDIDKKAGRKKGKTPVGLDGIPGRFNLTIKNQAEPAMSVNKGGQHNFTESASDRGFAQMIPLKELLQVGKGFIDSGKIHIKAEITLSVSRGAAAPGTLQTSGVAPKPKGKPGELSESGRRMHLSKCDLSLGESLLVYESWNPAVGKMPPPIQQTQYGQIARTLSDVEKPVSGKHGGNQSLTVVPVDQPGGILRLEPGARVDCRDEFGMWLEAVIEHVDVRGKRVFVHYKNWKDNYDRWIELAGEIGRNSFAHLQTCSRPRPTGRSESKRCLHHPELRQKESAVKSKPLFAENETVRIHTLKPLPRRWVEGTVDRIKDQQVRVKYTIGEETYHWWFHVNHGEIRKLTDKSSDSDPAIHSQLTPSNEKIIREWRASKVRSWESKGKLFAKYNTREKLEIWLDAQCLKARQQLFKKQKEQERAATQQAPPGPKDQPAAQQQEQLQQEQKEAKQKMRRNRRRKKKKGTKQAANGTPGRTGETRKVDGDEFGDIDLGPLDFEKAAMGNRAPTQDDLRHLNMEGIVTGYRSKIKILKDLRNRIGRLSQHLAKLCAA